MSHTVTVTRIIDDPNPEVDADDAEYTIGGEHDQYCTAYQECMKAWHRHPKSDEIVGDEWGNARIGCHAWIDGCWMLPMKNRCGFDISFEYENPQFQMTELGVYDVTVEWDGDWWLAALTLRTDPLSVAGSDHE